MPTIITDASKELSFQCISEEIIWLGNQSSQYQCNVYRMSLILHYRHTYFAACLQFNVVLELHRRDSDRIYGAWMSHISGDVRGEVQIGLRGIESFPAHGLQL